jgi:hypothetical protein
MLARTSFRDRLVAWLETKEPEGKYDWETSWTNCMYGEFCRETHAEKSCGGGMPVELSYPGYSERIAVASTKPWTYGAALKRARELPL